MKIELPNDRLLVKLPPKVALVLFLIKAELRNVKFISNLTKAGIEAELGILDFSPLIATIMDFEHYHDDEFKEWYFDRQTQLAEHINLENDHELWEQAFDFYMDLVAKTRK